MKYMMLVVADPDARDEPQDPAVDDVEDWVDKHDASGRRVMGERLRPPESATTVRRRDGKLLVTDGPFAESREWIAGFDILDCADLDEAIAVAAAHPMSAGGTLELRPFWPFDES
ncbi:YciI family protein [Aeromicrobium sp.]|uniref:YciI family protein n=1 Tax=Aeromicrobium sp. TaxID=1871063 RepID=UPI0030BB1B10